MIRRAVNLRVANRRFASHRVATGRFVRPLVALCVGAAALATGAAAQDAALPPAAGTLKLAAGFAPDPRQVTVPAGGPHDAGIAFGGGCVGFVATAPALAIAYAGGSGPLVISAASAVDTTLIVRDPSGNVVCDDDGGGNLNPAVTLTAPPTGRYAIWVGTFAAGQEATANLTISGRSGAAERPGSVDPLLPPVFGTVTLAAGFAPQPHEMPVQVNFDLDAGPAGCRGYVTAAPTALLSFTAAGDRPLVIGAVSEIDTTLAVVGPDGTVLCDDDGGEGFNPEITIAAPASGAYAIWVGLYSIGQGAPVPASLRIGEGAVAIPTVPGAVLNMTLPPQHGPIALPAAFKPDPFELPLTAGGPIRASEAVAAACWGYFPVEPSLVVTVEGTGPLAIWAEGGRDTALVVNTPSGDWFCNDDGGVALNPALYWDQALRGLYHIWVGTFLPVPTETTLKVSARIDPIDPTPDVPPILKLPAG